jgi:hypothetical protein
MDRKRLNFIAERLLGIPLLILVLAPGAALAQEPAHSLKELESRVHIGDTVRIVDSAGQKTQGKFESISESSLRIRVEGSVREFREPAIREVQREFRDPIGNGAFKGALIGGGAGLAAGVVIATGEACESGACAMQAVALAGAMGAGIGAASGALVDSLKHSYATIFTGPTLNRGWSVSPILSRDSKGVRVTVRF